MPLVKWTSATLCVLLKEGDINERWESFLRTEKALEDEKIKLCQKDRQLTYQIGKFCKTVREEGYELTKDNKWVKREI
jgi:hypothetical protein